ncbi:BTAD domain-containing putative transcriptional regulator [Streptomyces sp. TRM64462]|uniref:AfsR/SARP family transcriptional regulator n=1 Tax=Streptomyces sp. TRM64462 TaxID=2741726 RepID=UPI0015861248|nr:BTAD domain-containing putative transcriptional regulator [Streptomyces sp. TRM64462]
MPVEFCVLRDVVASVDGLGLELGHARQRSVLAVLLVEAPHAVPVDRLVERVWGDHAPQRVRETLYGYLSRLRKALAPAGQDASIVRHSGGYALVADARSIDLHHFRTLAARARAAGEPAAAAALFEQALGLWTGEPFALCDTPWFASLREELRHERFTVVLDHNDVRLRLGRHGELPAELSTAVDEHPLDERLAGQLMLALYRSGRAADALTRYQELRERLAEELGADPGPRLRTLHRQILTNDPALAPPEAAEGAPIPSRDQAPGSGTAPAGRHSGTAHRPVPRQLPGPPRRFTGRVRELARLDELLSPAESTGTVVISAIGGAGGVGKTWLALHWAHHHLRRFPDGQLYADLRGFDPSADPVPPGAAVRGFLDALGADPARIPADLDGQAGLYRSLTAGRRMLIVLDDIRDSAQVVPLLPGSPTCTVLITSRNRLTGLAATHGAGMLGLDVLIEAEARELLVRHLGRRRTDAEPEAVASLLRHCAGLPLAIGILAARAAADPELPLSALAEEVREAAGRLDALDTGDVAADLRAVFSSSYHALDPATAEVFALLGLTSGPDIAVPAVAALTALPAPRARVLLRRLQAAHLVQEHVPGRYRMHDLTRLYAGERASALPAADRHAACHRLLDSWLHTAHAAAGRLDPHRDHVPPGGPRPDVVPEEVPDHDAALAWFTAEHAVLLGAVDLAVEHRFDTHVWQLARSLETFFDYRGHWHDWAATQHTALLAARRLGNLSWQAGAHRSLGSVHTQTGRLDDGYAHFLHALDLYRRIDDPVSEAHTHRGLGWVRDRQGRRRDSLHHNEQALALYRKAGHLPGQALALNNAGWLRALLGDHRSSLDHCTQAVALNQEIGDLHAEAGAWDSLGYAHHHLSQYAEAISCYERALGLVRGFGDRYGETEILNHLGDTRLAAHDRDAARTVWRQALRIAEGMGHPAVDELHGKLAGLDGTTPEDAAGGAPA